jgi:hypothetical protein
LENRDKTYDGKYSSTKDHERLVWSKLGDCNSDNNGEYNYSDEVWNCANTRSFSSCAFNSLEVERDVEDVPSEVRKGKQTMILKAYA